MMVVVVGNILTAESRRANLIVTTQYDRPACESDTFGVGEDG